MQEIELTVNNEGKSNMYDSISINKVYNAIFSTTKDPSAAYVVNGDGDNEDSISGTVMFSGEKAVGYLDGDETAIVKAINGKLKDYKLAFNGDEYSVSSKGALVMGTGSGQPGGAGNAVGGRKADCPSQKGRTKVF